MLPLRELARTRRGPAQAASIADDDTVSSAGTGLDAPCRRRSALNGLHVEHHTEHQDRSRMDRTQRATLIATGLGLFMIFLDALIVNVALPDIQRQFNVGEAGLQWVVAAYSLGMAI